MEHFSPRVHYVRRSNNWNARGIIYSVYLLFMQITERGECTSLSYQNRRVRAFIIYEVVCPYFTYTDGAARVCLDVIHILLLLQARRWENNYIPFWQKFFFRRVNSKQFPNGFPRTRIWYHVDDTFAIVDTKFNVDDFPENLNCQYSLIKLTSDKKKGRGEITIFRSRC